MPFIFLLLAITLGCSQNKKVNQRCEQPCRGDEASDGANATFDPLKVPNAPEGPWRLVLDEGAVKDAKTGLKRVKISWNAYPDAKKYILTYALDKECANPIRTHEINGIFYDQIYSREIPVESGMTFFVCLKANLPNQAIVTPENSPLAIGSESPLRPDFRVLPPLPPMQTGTFKISWTEAKGVKSYEILIVDNKGFAAKIIRDIKSTEAVVTHEIADLPQGRYFLRVSGVESSGAKATALTDRRNEAYEFLMAPSPAGTWSVLKPSAPLLTARTDAAVAATSKGILVWGGSTPKGIAQDGAIYNPTANAWTPMATLNSPEPRIGPSAWTGSLLALWGGSDFDIGTYKSSKVLNTGATYNPSSDQWTPMAAAGAPTPRQGHTLTVMGDSIFVWGGVNRPSMDEKSAATLGDGGIYNTVTQTWTPVTSSSGSTRAYHCSVWTGTHVIVWGGAQKNPDEDFSLTASGEMFDPATREWRPISNQGQPIARYVHNCVWTGKKMLVWGGHVRFFALANGAAYDPQTNTWSPMEDTKAPIPVVGEGYHWTGKYFMVWGGRQGESNLLQLGGLYDPEKNQWQFTSLEGAPSPRWGTPLTGQGNKVYFFGGDSVQKGANPPGKIYDELVEFTVPP